MDLQGSNLWPSACKADALPAELRSHIKYLQYIIVNDPDGVRTHDLRRDRARSNQLSHQAILIDYYK